MELTAAYGLAIGNAIINNAPLLVGFILPPFVEILNRDIENDTARLVVALLASFFVAIVLHWNEIAFGNPGQVAALAGVIFTESHFTYKTYFHDSYLRYKLNTAIGSRKGSEEGESEEVQEPLQVSSVPLEQ